MHARNQPLLTVNGQSDLGNLACDSDHQSRTKTWSRVICGVSMSTTNRNAFNNEMNVHAGKLPADSKSLCIPVTMKGELKVH